MRSPPNRRARRLGCRARRGAGCDDRSADRSGTADRLVPQRRAAHRRGPLETGSLRQGRRRREACEGLPEVSRPALERLGRPSCRVNGGRLGPRQRGAAAGVLAQDGRRVLARPGVLVPRVAGLGLGRRSVHVWRHAGTMPTDTSIGELASYIAERLANATWPFGGDAPSEKRSLFGGRRRGVQ